MERQTTHATEEPAGAAPFDVFLRRLDRQQTHMMEERPRMAQVDAFCRRLERETVQPGLPALESFAWERSFPGLVHPAIQGSRRSVNWVGQ